LYLEVFVHLVSLDLEVTLNGLSSVREVVLALSVNIKHSENLSDFSNGLGSSSLVRLWNFFCKYCILEEISLDCAELRTFDFKADRNGLIIGPDA
jgi:hypothetical protein